MKKIIIVLFVALMYSYNMNAQVTDKEEDLKTVSKDSTDGWEKGGIFSFTLGQTSFTNWAAGGINSFSINGLGGLFADYKKNKLTWDNTLDFGYGILKQGKGDNSNLLKTDDKFDLASKLGFKATDKLYYAALVNFKTQFTDGFEYPDDSTVISSFMSPGYLLAAAGIDYRPNKYFSVFVAPLTSKTTFVRNQALADSSAFGVEAGENIRNEFGGYIKTVFTKDIVKNINLSTKLDLFSNYLNNPEKIDINWEVLLSMKVNKFITANISTQLIRDFDIKFEKTDDLGNVIGEEERIQFKEILGVGFSFKF